MDHSLYQEAYRVKELALTRYRPGIMLAATFKKGRVFNNIYYFNPADISVTIPAFWGDEFYLFSVKSADSLMDQEARAEALHLQEIRAAINKKSLFGVIEANPQ